ncbi:hypothetical protein ACFYT4_07205 [Streptomyces sp. NPDC004609]|uniref:hypothetical protein n=1 Tax=Streptomyces sp. NPDC004609 TaxID=3364704 RepID=UPI0036B7F101
MDGSRIGEDTGSTGTAVRPTAVRRAGTAASPGTTVPPGHDGFTRHDGSMDYDGED